MYKYNRQIVNLKANCAAGDSGLVIPVELNGYTQPFSNAYAMYLTKGYVRIIVQVMIRLLTRRTSNMMTISTSTLRENLRSILNQAAQNHEAILVERRTGANMVLISQDDYNAMEETAYLLRSPANAQRLHEALEEIEHGTPKSVAIEDLTDE